jgi:hypothetical protein
MNRVVTESVSPGDEIDALLNAFYKAEVPAPWPAFRLPARTRLQPPAQPGARSGAGWSPRLALAVAIALLLAAMWLLPRPSLTSDGSRPASMNTIGPHGANKGGILPPAPASMDKPGTLTPNKVKSSLHLEQRKDGSTNIKITVEELPANK